VNRYSRCIDSDAYRAIRFDQRVLKVDAEPVYPLLMVE
jgi:hypothetical protein